MDVFFDANDHSKVCVDIASVVSAAPPASAVSDPAMAATSAELKTWSVNNPPSIRKQMQMRDQLRAFQLAQARLGKGTVIVTGTGGNIPGQVVHIQGPTDVQGEEGGSAEKVDQLARLADL